MMEQAKSKDVVSSGLVARPGSDEQLIAMGEYFFECYDKDGNLKWTDTAKNTVVSTGLQNMCGVGLDGTTTRYTTWYVGLKGAGTVVAGDTLASHAGWAEFAAGTAYSGNRPAFVPNTAATTATPSVVTNSSYKASFSILASNTVTGALLCSVASGTAAPNILFSAGDFATSRTVVNGDTLQVTYQFSLAA